MNIGAQTYNGTSNILITAPNPFQLNAWNHFAFVQKGTTGFFFLNGQTNSKYNGEFYSPNKINRAYNFIGKSNWLKSSDMDADANIDELKIFSRDLSQSEVQIEMINEFYSINKASQIV